MIVGIPSLETILEINQFVIIQETFKLDILNFIFHNIYFFAAEFNAISHFVCETFTYDDFDIQNFLTL